MLTYGGISGLELSFFVSIPLLYWFSILLGSTFETGRRGGLKKRRGFQEAVCIEQVHLLNQIFLVTVFSFNYSSS